jgi:hypothetical protein
MKKISLIEGFSLLDISYRNFDSFSYMDIPPPNYFPLLHYKFSLSFLPLTNPPPLSSLPPYTPTPNPLLFPHSSL